MAFTLILEILGLLWKNDDFLDQDDLYEVQEKTADLAWKLARTKEKRKILMDKFPWVYKGCIEIRRKTK